MSSVSNYMFNTCTNRTRPCLNVVLSLRVQLNNQTKQVCSTAVLSAEGLSLLRQRHLLRGCDSFLPTTTTTGFSSLEMRRRRRGLIIKPLNDDETEDERKLLRSDEAGYVTTTWCRLCSPMHHENLRAKGSRWTVREAHPFWQERRRSGKQRGSFHLASSYMAVYSCQDVCTHGIFWPPAAVPSTYCSPPMQRSNCRDQPALTVTRKRQGGGVHNPPGPSDLQPASLPPDPNIIEKK